MRYKNLWNGAIILVAVGVLAVAVSCRFMKTATNADQQESSPATTITELSEADREALARQATIRAAEETERRRQQELAATLRRRRVAERLRSKAERAEAQLRRVFDAVVPTGKFDLIQNGLDEWGATVTIESFDSDLLNFAGRARLRSSMPFSDVPVSGRVDAKGRLLIEGVHPTIPVILDTVSSAGVISGGQWVVEPWSVPREHQRQVQESRFENVVAQSFTPTITTWEGRKRNGLISGLKLLRARAQVNTGNYGRTRRWFDDDFSTAYGENDGNLSVVARYVVPVHAEGILVNYCNSISGGVVRINGGNQVGLPPGNKATAVLVDFGKQIEIVELLIECRVGWVCFSEIALVEQVPNAKSKPKSKRKRKRRR